jgi:hypothetical protein
MAQDGRDKLVDRFSHEHMEVVIMRRHPRAFALLFGLVLAFTWPRLVFAAELQARTIAAFDRYVAEAERQMATTIDDPARFIWIDGLAVPDQRARLDALRAGGLLIERLETRQAGKKLEVQGGLIHHWLGAVFVPGVSVDKAVALLQDYDHHGDIYKPAVARARLIARDSDVFRVYLRFFMKKVITVVVNSEHEARFSRPNPTRAYSRIVSTRIAEVEHPDTPREAEQPVGHDGGYLWRLNTYWRFLERDGGTYVQCESITLTRAIPMGLGWLIGPFVTSIPRDSLTFTLETTRGTLAVP